MSYTQQAPPRKNYTPLPNEVFSLGLSPGELAVYAYCTALTVPFAIAWLQLVVHHPMNSRVSFHKQRIIYSDRNL